MTDLLPCPFCGKPTEYVCENDHHGDYFRLGCTDEDCPAHWTYYTEPQENSEECIRRWNTRAVSSCVTGEPQRVGCGTPGCTDPDCQYGKEPPTRDDIAEAIFKTLRPDNPNRVNELFPSAAEIYFAAADAVLALSRPEGK